MDWLLWKLRQCCPPPQRPTPQGGREDGEAGVLLAIPSWATTASGPYPPYACGLCPWIRVASSRSRSWRMAGALQPHPRARRWPPPPPPSASRFLYIAGGSLWKKSPKTGTSVRPGCTSCTRRRSVQRRLWGLRGHLGLWLWVSCGALGSWQRWREPCPPDRTAYPLLTRPDAPRGNREKSVAKYL